MSGSTSPITARISLHGEWLFMYRIILSSGDLAHIRIAESDSPTMEALFALEVLRRGSGEGFSSWRQQVLESSCRIDPGTEGAAAEVAGCETARGAAQDLLHVAIMPYWERVSAYLETARDALREIMCRDGVGALLGNLGPGIRWNAPALEIAGSHSGEFELQGRGLILAPSLFLQRAGHVGLASRRGAHDSPLLVFPDRPGPEQLANLLGKRRVGDPYQASDSLAALVGRTRAAALRALKEGCTNTDLAEQLGVSTAAVSQHMAILRAAGLISTHRGRSHAIHTVTRLGRLLLRGDGVESLLAPTVAPRPPIRQSSRVRRVSSTEPMPRTPGVVGMRSMLS
ncbi:ArsR/SmtB family transcription factor [Streptomyces sp. CAS3]